MPETMISDFVLETEKEAAIYSHLSLRDLPREEPTREAWIELTKRAHLPGTHHSRWAMTLGTTEIVEMQVSYGVEGPITGLDTIEQNEAQVKNLISCARLLPVSYRESLVTRLFELFEDSKEENRNGAGISIESLHTFYTFLQIHYYLKKPAIGLTPDNDIYVTWKAGRDTVFSVHFLSSGLARFVILAPAAKHPGQQVRLSGIANVEDLVEKVKPWGVLSWAGNEGR